MNNDYFKEDKYWKKHVNDNLEFDNYLDEYIYYLPKTGKVLDLGCGIGGYSKYFIDKGYDVISSDISDIALNKVKEFNNNIIKLDMRDNLPFDNDTFDIIIANLSIHYFNEIETQKLLSEIYRMLKDNGIFIGTVNSIKALKFIKDHAIELGKHYYQSNDRKIRLFDMNDIDYYFQDFNKILVEERIIKRFDERKDYILFIMKK